MPSEKEIREERDAVWGGLNEFLAEAKIEHPALQDKAKHMLQGALLFSGWTQRSEAWSKKQVKQVLQGFKNEGFLDGPKEKKGEGSGSGAGADKTN